MQATLLGAYQSLVHDINNNSANKMANKKKN